MRAWDLSCRSLSSTTKQTTSEAQQAGQTNGQTQIDNETVAKLLAAAAMARRWLPPNGFHPNPSSSSSSSCATEDNGPSRLASPADETKQGQPHTLAHLHSPASSNSMSSSSSGVWSVSEGSNSESSSYRTNSSPGSEFLAPTCKLSSTHSPSPLGSWTPEESTNDKRLLGRGIGGAIQRPSPSQCVDRKARKKDQNRRAAYNYRRKKMEERDRMMQEEARLVHKHVKLTGKIARLEHRISSILVTRARKILDTNGHPLWYLCPICLVSCSDVLDLRQHFKFTHYPAALVPDLNTQPSLGIYNKGEINSDISRLSFDSSLNGGYKNVNSSSEYSSEEETCGPKSQDHLGS